MPPFRITEIGEPHCCKPVALFLSECHCSRQMCGHNLINVRLCHCFFLCSVATCRDNLVARLNFVFPSLLQPQLFDSTSIRGSQRGHVSYLLYCFLFASWHRPDTRQVFLFSTTFLTIVITDIPARAGAEVGHVASCPAQLYHQTATRVRTQFSRSHDSSTILSRQ